MKIWKNIEMSHIKDIVISHKVVYNKNKNNDYVLDEKRSKESVLKQSDENIPRCLTGDEMADYIRDYVGSKKWKIVLSSSTINIFKKKKLHKRE